MFSIVDTIKECQPSYSHQIFLLCLREEYTIVPLRYLLESIKFCVSEKDEYKLGIFKSALDWKLGKDSQFLLDIIK